MQTEDVVLENMKEMKLSIEKNNSNMKNRKQHKLLQQRRNRKKKRSETSMHNDRDRDDGMREKEVKTKEKKEEMEKSEKNHKVTPRKLVKKKREKVKKEDLAEEEWDNMEKEVEVEEDALVWMGDLNYRLDLPRLQVLHCNCIVRYNSIIVYCIVSYVMCYNLLCACVFVLYYTSVNTCIVVSSMFTFTSHSLLCCCYYCCCSSLFIDLCALCLL